MFKKIKKILLGSLSILLISTISFAVVLINPEISYANKTSIGQVDIHHDAPLQENTLQIVSDAIDILKKSKLYKEEYHFDLCLNDGSNYPNLHPLIKGQDAIGYAFLNKAVFFKTTPNFKTNRSISQWEVNDYETRYFDIKQLIAHELTHCLQNKDNFWIQLKAGFWKLEGHAEYISKEWQGDELLKEKLINYLEEEKKEKTGIPILEFEDGTMQSMHYHKYALVCQYMMDIEGMDYHAFMDDTRSLEQMYDELLQWSKTQI